MPLKTPSLLAGRNTTPLDKDRERKVVNTFLQLDSSVNARHDATSRTRFLVRTDEDGLRFGEIAFGCDIFPGTSIANANSALSMRAAVAHELTHHRRWSNMRAIDEPELMHLDEALTSLEATQEFGQDLNLTEVRGLIADAIERLHLLKRSVLSTNPSINVDQTEDGGSANADSTEGDDSSVPIPQ